MLFCCSNTRMKVVNICVYHSVLEMTVLPNDVRVEGDPRDWDLWERENVYNYVKFPVNIAWCCLMY